MEKIAASTFPLDASDAVGATERPDHSEAVGFSLAHALDSPPPVPASAPTTVSTYYHRVFWQPDVRWLLKM
jgi:hypothetical protein